MDQNGFFGLDPFALSFKLVLLETGKKA